MTATNAQITQALAMALAAIDELKGEAVNTFDVTELTTITDYMVICSGQSARHVKSIANHVVEQAKKAQLQPRVEGLEEAEWVLIDLNGVIVHVLQPTARAYYQIEKLWDIDPGAAASRHSN
ncbi:MAG TPA: ribosome silencing factor [Salinisphaeraceae bacterium]|nr:ribosome silencing factor [Salinisphaeraceae bacterium]